MLFVLFILNSSGQWAGHPCAGRAGQSRAGREESDEINASE